MKIITGEFLAGLSRTSPKVKERSRSPVAGKDLRLPKPKRLKVREK